MTYLLGGSKGCTRLDPRSSLCKAISRYVGISEFTKLCELLADFVGEALPHDGAALRVTLFGLWRALFLDLEGSWVEARLRVGSGLVRIVVNC